MAALISINVINLRAHSLPQASNNTNFCRAEALKLYSKYRNEHNDEFARLMGREQIGPLLTKRDIIGYKKSLNLVSENLIEELPMSCREDNSDQFILYLRAINQQKHNLKDNEAYLQLLKSAAAKKDDNSSFGDCKYDGAPLDYYCGAGLPEAHLSLANFYIDKYRKNKSSLCNKDFMEHVAAVFEANLIQGIELENKGIGPSEKPYVLKNNMKSECFLEIRNRFYGVYFGE